MESDKVFFVAEVFFHEKKQWLMNNEWFLTTTWELMM